MFSVRKKRSKFLIAVITEYDDSRTNVCYKTGRAIRQINIDGNHSECLKLLEQICEIQIEIEWSQTQLVFDENMMSTR